jgi:hypothetical protein
MSGFERFAMWLCRLAVWMCAAMLSGCVVPFEHHFGASAGGYFVHGADRREGGGGAWAVEGSAGGGVGLGCRDRDWSPFLRAEMAGGYDDALGEPYGALRVGAGYRQELGAALFETSATAGPILGGWGSGGGGLLAAGFGLRVGQADDGPKYRAFKYVVVEAVVDLRTLRRINDELVSEPETQVFFGIRLRSLLRRVPPCYGPRPRRPGHRR